MIKLVNRAKMTTATIGTGTMTLGAAVDGYQSFADAGVADGDVVRYVIEDGDAWEIGTGIYAASGATLTRTVSESSVSGSALNLTGNATVFVGAAAEDIGGLVPGQMILAISGYTFLGLLECDGSQVDEFAYRNLAPFLKTTYSLTDVIDLGVNGKLILPVVLDGKAFYFWDRNGNGVPETQSADGYSHVELDNIFNGGADTTDTERSTTINGINVELPTVSEYQALHSALGGRPAGWPNLYYWTSTLASAGNHFQFYLGSGVFSSLTDAGVRGVGLHVPAPPGGVTVGSALPDSATDLAAPTGYSYYIKY